MKTLKVLSALLAYPSADLVAAADELKGALLAERVIPRQQLEAVLRLIDEMAQGEL